MSGPIVEHDVGRTLVNRGSIPAGTEGTIVAIDGEGLGCEVEFWDSAHCSAELVTYTPDELELSVPCPPVAIRISSEFLRGPVWTIDRRDGCPTYDLPPLVHDDPVVKALDKELGDMYSSYYEFDSHDQACWFDEERERRDKPRTLELLARLNARLAEINDGSFVVDDWETPRVQGL